MNDLPTLDPYARMVRALESCTFLPGSWDKRFVQDVSGKPDSAMTSKQKASVLQLVYKYRRQLSVEIIILAQDTAEEAA